MVPQSNELVDRQASAYYHLLKNSNKFFGENSPTGGKCQFNTGSLQGYRSVLQDFVISQIILASWRGGTEKAYSPAWRKWTVWCDKMVSNCFPSTICPVIKFLIDQCKEGTELFRLLVHPQFTHVHAVVKSAWLLPDHDLREVKMAGSCSECFKVVEPSTGCNVVSVSGQHIMVNNPPFPCKAGTGKQVTVTPLSGTLISH